MAIKKPDAVLKPVVYMAARPGIGTTLAAELLASGAIASVKLGRRRLIHIDEIERVARQGLGTAKADAG